MALQSKITDICVRFGLRLESSFSKIEMERWNNDQVKNNGKGREFSSCQIISHCDTLVSGGRTPMNMRLRKYLLDVIEESCTQ